MHSLDMLQRSRELFLTLITARFEVRGEEVGSGEGPPTRCAEIPRVLATAHVGCWVNQGLCGSNVKDSWDNWQGPEARR